MPLHDWSRVDAGIFHNFHVLWMGRMDALLNEELLPDPFYALAEPVVGDAVPDVLALERVSEGGEEILDSPRLVREDGSQNPVALAPSPVLTQELIPPEDYAPLARRLAIRDRLRGDRVVAIVEIVSLANKSSRERRDRFIEKSVETLRRGIHLLIIDLQPPTSLVPHGFHRPIAEAFAGTAPEDAAGRPLETASYQVAGGGVVRAYVVALRVGDRLPEMPIFLLPGRFVRIPLERTYVEAFRSQPRHVKDHLEA